jgi:hypothetical protein
MKSIFYFHPTALRYNSDESKEEYVAKFSKLIEDLAFVINLPEEEHKFVCSDLMYEDEVYCDKDIYSFASENLDRDQMALLYQILEKFSETSSLSFEKIESLTYYSENEQACHALIILNRLPNIVTKNNYIQFNKYELVYNQGSWLTVMRQIMGNHPESPSAFMRRAKAYFPNIVFSSNCEKVIEPFLATIPRKIVYYLSCMNDQLIDFWDKHPDKNSINKVCADFAGQYGMDRAGSQQGTPSKKVEYTYEFEINNTTEVKCCGPHFKITHTDDNCKTIPSTKQYHARIYFCISDGNICVGSIGPHI